MQGMGLPLVTDPRLQFDPRSNWDERLLQAAEGLVDAGCVSEVRVHQKGSVITGIVREDLLTARHGRRHRVYIRCANGSSQLQAECSCGAVGICVHAAAVSLAASSPAQEMPPPAGPPALSARLDAPSAEAGLRAARTAPQQLLYLLQSDTDSMQAPGSGMLHLTIWIGAASATRPDGAIEAVAFAPRAARHRGQYPRYVSESDASILEMLLSERSDGPWCLRGRCGARVIQRIMASRRAFWGALRSPPLREGAPRRAWLSWCMEESGDQYLTGQVDDSATVLLSLEPAFYVDVGTGEWGVAELPFPQALVDRYAGRRVAPEQVDALIDELDGEANTPMFPRPASLVIERQSFSGLRARLNLGAGAEARLEYLYNGVAVDSQCLDAHEDYVRSAVAGTVREIPRDREREKALAARLAIVLPKCASGCEAWLSFVLDAAPALEREGWEILIEAGFPFRLAQLERWFGELESASRDDWFSLRLGAMVDGRPVNLLPALAAYLQDSAKGESAPESTRAPDEPASLQIGEHWLLRLEDGRYLPIGMDRIRRIAATLVELFEPDGLDDRRRLVMPRTQRYRLAPLLGFAEVTLSSSEPEVRDLPGEINEFTAIQPVAVPEGFRATLRPYQCEGLAWLQFLRRHRLGGLLADDMGLGKTVQALAHLLLEKDAGRLQRPALIVAPVSALANWQQEIQRLAPALRWLTLHGPGRRERFAAIASADVVITGYPQLQLDTDLLLEQDFYMVILDEAQVIKNPRAKVSQTARALRTEHRLCLTGTPVENHLGELWALFAFAEPRLLGDERQFQRQYRVPIERGGDRLRAESLAGRLAPCLLRRTKDAVARELPSKSEMIETIVLDERQRDFYDAIRLASHRRLREILARQGLARSQITILDALLKLRQACCDPRLIVPAGGAGETIPSAKLDWLAAALPELAAEGRRILLFSQFTSMLRLIETKVRELEIPYCLLTGETRDRAAQVGRFQSGGAPLFLISLKAGGTALNLTAADTVIHYDPWWNPASEAQATDRAHRIGQDRPVFVYKPIAQNTVEERMLALQDEKRALAAGIFASRGRGSPLALSEIDLERLLTA